MASRDLNDLRADIRALAVKHVAECKKQANIDLLIYCTHRSSAEQNEAYACGRTAPGKVVTNCRGGESKHNNVDANFKAASLAYDCVPLIGGKPQWGDDSLYMKVGQIGESLGLKWAGRWTGKLREKAHFEI